MLNQNKASLTLLTHYNSDLGSRVGTSISTHAMLITDISISRFFSPERKNVIYLYQ
jgi:hypothetical protein